MKFFEWYITWTRGPDYWFIIPTFTTFYNEGRIRLAFMWLKLEIGFDYEKGEKEVNEECEHANVINYKCMTCGVEFLYCRVCSIFNETACYHLPPICKEGNQ